MRPFSLFIALALTAPLFAGSIEVVVRDGRGAAVQDAVVYAVPEGKQPPVVKRTAIMDQRDRTFVPHVLAVQAGTAVSFPNSDDVRHHVYSFSPAKIFQLPLYKGVPSSRVVFDKPGVISLGCNIHDRMSAFIVVVNTPYFQKSDGNGLVSMEGVPPGRYEMHLWYPDMRQEPAPGSITVIGEERHELSFSTNSRQLAVEAGSR